MIIDKSTNSFATSPYPTRTTSNQYNQTIEQNASVGTKDEFIQSDTSKLMSTFRKMFATQDTTDMLGKVNSEKYMYESYSPKLGTDYLEDSVKVYEDLRSQIENQFKDDYDSKRNYLAALDIAHKDHLNKSADRIASELSSKRALGSYDDPITSGPGDKRNIKLQQSIYDSLKIANEQFLRTYKDNRSMGVEKALEKAISKVEEADSKSLYEMSYRDIKIVHKNIYEKANYSVNPDQDLINKFTSASQDSRTSEVMKNILNEHLDRENFLYDRNEKLPPRVKWNTAIMIFRGESKGVTEKVENNETSTKATNEDKKETSDKQALWQELSKLISDTGIYLNQFFGEKDAKSYVGKNFFNINMTQTAFARMGNDSAFKEMIFSGIKEIEKQFKQPESTLARGVVIGDKGFESSWMYSQHASKTFFSQTKL